MVHSPLPWTRSEATAILLDNFHPGIPGWRGCCQSAEFRFDSCTFLVASRDTAKPPLTRELIVLPPEGPRWNADAHRQHSRRKSRFGGCPMRRVGERPLFSGDACDEVSQSEKGGDLRYSFKYYSFFEDRADDSNRRTSDNVLILPLEGKVDRDVGICHGATS